MVTDADIPTNLGARTNEDEILVLACQECILWAEPALPRQLRFDEPGSDKLTVRLVA